jgi:transposase-like protein
MSKTRKSYTPAFKAALVQELLREEQTLNQIASKHGVHPNQLRRWREAAVEAMPDNFTDEDKYQKRLANLNAEHEREIEKLYAQRGLLTTELEWLKKNFTSCGLSSEPNFPGRAPGRGRQE